MTQAVHDRRPLATPLGINKPFNLTTVNTTAISVVELITRVSVNDTQTYISRDITFYTLPLAAFHVTLVKVS